MVIPCRQLMRKNADIVKKLSVEIPSQEMESEQDIYFFFVCKDVMEALDRRKLFVEAGYEAHWENIVGDTRFNLLVYVFTYLRVEEICAHECRILSVAEDFISDYRGWELQKIE